MRVARRNHVSLLVHLVWNTQDRLPMVTPEIERAVYRCIAAEATKRNCQVFALNGMPDHVHLVVLLPTSLSVAKLAQQVKGVSSAFVRDQFGGERFFQWAEGYGVFSLSRNHLPRVIEYVKNQKEHHKSGKLWMLWEQPDAPEEASQNRGD